MRLKAFIAVALVAVAAGASAQTYKETTTKTDKKGTTTTTKTTTVTGEVVRYEPGQVIVIREPGKAEVTYTLTPSIKVPAEVAVGRTVSVYTEPGPEGRVIVERIVTTSVTPEGEVKRTTEETKTHPSGAVTKTVTTSVTGTVEAYEAGKTITITRPGGERVTYVINEKSTIPADLAIGKTVTLRAIPGASAEEKLVRTVTYTRTRTKGGKTITKTKTETKPQ
jgi:hypothetical protein